ncbi:MAG: DUF86 domain-containing protein [Anaerolineales bacterium]|nr:DUF86 domain-containing protein [Anaerolineales bacterium]
MVGFRNILVLQYQKVDIKIMVKIIENHLAELFEFANVAVNASD